MLSMIRKELKLLRKGKGNFFFLIVMPALFIVLFGSIFSGVSNSKVTVNYVDGDRSAISRSFVQAIGRVQSFTLKQNAALTVDEQIQQIKDGKITSLVVIPKGFGAGIASGRGQTDIKFYRDVTQEAVNGPIETVLNSVANVYQKQHISSALAAQGKSPAQIQSVLQPPIQIQPIQESGSGGNSVSALEQVVPGYTVMFVFFIILTMMRGFLGEKESGMLARLRSTPMRPMTYLIGMWVPSIIAVLIQCIVLLAFGHFVYHVNLGDISAIAVIVLCLSICGTGIGLAVSFLIRGENHGRAITMLITLGGAGLGGVWVPAQFMPHFAQVLGRLTPQYWAQHGFLDVMVHGAHIRDEWQTFGILLAFGIGGLLVAMLRFGRFMRTATN